MMNKNVMTSSSTNTAILMENNTILNKKRMIQKQTMFHIFITVNPLLPHPLYISILQGDIFTHLIIQKISIKSNFNKLL